MKRAADDTDTDIHSKFARVDRSRDRRYKDDRDYARSDKGYDRKDYDRRYSDRDREADNDREFDQSKWSRPGSRDTYNNSNAPSSIHGSNNLASPTNASMSYDSNLIQQQYGMPPPSIPTSYDQQQMPFGSPLAPTTPSSYPPPSTYGIPSSWASTIRSVLPTTPWESTPASTHQTYHSSWDQVAVPGYSLGVNPDWVPTEAPSGLNPDWVPNDENENDATSTLIQPKQHSTPIEEQVSPDTPADSGSGSVLAAVAESDPVTRNEKKKSERGLREEVCR